MAFVVISKVIGFVIYTFSSVWVAEWPPFGKLLPARLAICSRCILSICNIYLFTVMVLRAEFAFRLPQFLFILLLLWSDTFSWLHGNSTLRRCLLCSIQKAFSASSSSVSWHASFSTDLSPMTSWTYWLSRCICWTRRYIYMHTLDIFSGEQTFQPP